MKPISKMSLAEREAHAGHEWKELLDWNTNEWFKINEELKKKGGDGIWIGRTTPARVYRIR